MISDKTIKRATLAGSIAGAYLTIVYIFLYRDSEPIMAGNVSSIDFLMAIYYVFNCLLLFLIYILVKRQVFFAKILSAVLAISVLASLSWSFFGGVLEGLLDTAFVTTVLLGSISGGIFPYLGVLPITLFFWGVISSVLFLFRSKSTNTQIIDIIS